MSTESNDPRELKVKIDNSSLVEMTKVSEAQRLEIEQLKRENLELLNKNKESGTGQLPFSLNQSSNNQEVPTIKKEFESVECMIDYLRSSKNAEDEELLNKIWRKSLNAMHNQPEKLLNFTYNAKIETDAQGNVTDSPIKRTLSKQNAQFRRA